MIFHTQKDLDCPLFFLFALYRFLLSYHLQSLFISYWILSAIRSIALSSMKLVLHSLIFSSLSCYIGRKLRQIAFKCERSVHSHGMLELGGRRAGRGMERKAVVPREREETELYAVLNTVLFPLTGWCLVRHLCFRLLIISYQTEGETKTCLLKFRSSWLYILLQIFSLTSLSSISFFCVAKLFLLCQCFLQPSYPSYSVVLPWTSYAAWNTRVLPQWRIAV